jgi:hypothetical protein
LNKVLKREDEQTRASGNGRRDEIYKHDGGINRARKRREFNNTVIRKTIKLTLVGDHVFSPLRRGKKKPARGVIWIRRWSDGGVPRRGERGEGRGESEIFLGVCWV